MAAPVEPPGWEDDIPDEVLEAELAAFDASLRGPLPEEELGGWIDDELSAAIDAELDRSQDPPVQPVQPVERVEPGWAVPGLPDGAHEDGDRAEGGLSAGSRAVLGELSAAWAALRAAHARCYRALAGLHASDALAESGYRYQSRLLEDQLRIDPAEAARLSRHARALTSTPTPTGTPVPVELPATAATVWAGQIGPGHVEVIAKTMRALRGVAPELPVEVLEATETELADLALTRSPAALAQAATAIQALLDPDGTAPDDSPPPPNELHYRRRRDGSLTGRFTYRDPAAAETLHTALTVATPPPEQITEPTQGQRAGVEPRGYSADAEAARTLPARRAHGLLDLAGEALTRGLNVPDPQPDQHDWGAHTAYEGMFPDPDQHHDTDNDEDSDQGSDQGSNTEGGAPADAGPPADPAGPAADAHDAGHAADAHDAGHADNSDRQDADDADNRDLSDHQDADAPDADAPDADEADRASSTGGSPAAGPPPTDSPPAGPSPTDPAPTDPATADPPAQPPWTRADVEGGERVALTVTLNYQTLRRTLANLPDPTPDPTRGAGDGHTGRLALLGENTWIRPETARRLACDAEIIPLVLGTRGEPLDLGRKHRLVPTALRRAVIARDRHCAHPGCRRRARRCQVHHIQHWADHGDTSLANCVLLCTYHHSLVHHSAWQIHMIDGLPWFTPPAYIDPQRTPRHNRPWQATTDAV